MNDDKRLVIDLATMPTYLGIAFIVMKLAGIIDWSWWWVLSPFWIPLLFIFIVATIVGFIWAVGEVNK